MKISCFVLWVIKYLKILYKIKVSFENLLFSVSDNCKWQLTDELKEIRNQKLNIKDIFYILLFGFQNKLLCLEQIVQIQRFITKW